MDVNERRKRGDGLFVAALAAGESVVAAAKQAGISEATAHRRLRDPAFRSLVGEAHAEILTRAVAKLTVSSTEAVDTLRLLLYSDMDFARLAAARSILELGVRLREHQDLEGRIRALEQVAAGVDGAQTDE